MHCIGFQLIMWMFVVLLQREEQGDNENFASSHGLVAMLLY